MPAPKGKQDPWNPTAQQKYAQGYTRGLTDAKKGQVYSSDRTAEDTSYGDGYDDGYYSSEQEESDRARGLYDE